MFDLLDECNAEEKLRQRRKRAGDRFIGEENSNENRNENENDNENDNGNKDDNEKKERKENKEDAPMVWNEEQHKRFFGESRDRLSVIVKIEKMKQIKVQNVRLMEHSRKQQQRRAQQKNSSDSKPNFESSQQQAIQQAPNWNTAELVIKYSRETNDWIDGIRTLIFAVYLSGKSLPTFSMTPEIVSGDYARLTYGGDVEIVHCPSMASLSLPKAPKRISTDHVQRNYKSIHRAAIQHGIFGNAMSIHICYNLDNLTNRRERTKVIATDNMLSDPAMEIVTNLMVSLYHCQRQYLLDKMIADEENKKKFGRELDGLACVKLLSSVKISY